METKELVLASQAGDINSFMELIRQKEGTFFRIAKAYTQNNYDAEDCVSDAVIHAYDRLGQLRSPEKFYVWFISILINLCRKKYRTAAVTVEYIPDIHGLFDEETLKHAENRILVEKIFSRLEDKEKEILVLRYLKDFTLEETAKILGVPEGTIKSRSSRIIAKIKSKYGRLFSNEAG